MATDQQSVSRILSVLSHPLRRDILFYIGEQAECSFTDLATALNVETAKLSFHLRNLDGFLEQTPTGKYKLSRVGEKAIVLVKDLQLWAVDLDIAQRASTLPVASPKKRVVAFIVDLGVALLFLLALPNVVSSIVSGGPFLEYVNFILFLILFWVYFTLLEGFAGQSLGKRIIGIRVIRIDEKKLFYDGAAVRNFGKVFLLPFDLLIGLRLKDKRFIRYFDKFSGTTVIDLRSQSAPFP